MNMSLQFVTIAGMDVQSKNKNGPPLREVGDIRTELTGRHCTKRCNSLDWMSPIFETLKMINLSITIIDYRILICQ